MYVSINSAGIKCIFFLVYEHILHVQPYANVLCVYVYMCEYKVVWSTRFLSLSSLNGRQGST